MVLVVGSTGRLGGDIDRRLNALGRPVRGLVRSTSALEKVAALQKLGIACVTGDLRDPASLAAACQGVDAVISTATAISTRQPGDTLADIDEQGHANLVRAARDAGVRQFIYISFSGNVDSGSNPSAITQAKRAAEQSVIDSGMTYTILRPSVFMESWLSPALGFDYIHGKAIIFGSGNCPISWISMYDVARFALLALDVPPIQNVVLELGGPQALSQREVVRLFERLSGQTFDLEVLSEESLEARRAAAQDAMGKSFESLRLALAHGDAIDMETLLRQLDLPMTTVQGYALRVLGALREQERGSEIIRQLVELVDFLVDAIGSGQFGFDRAMFRYVETNGGELARAFADFPRRMGEVNPEKDTDYALSMAVRRDVLRGVARQFNLPEVTRFTDALIRSQDERINLYRTLATQAELLRSP